MLFFLIYCFRVTVQYRDVCLMHGLYVNVKLAMASLIVKGDFRGLRRIWLWGLNGYVLGVLKGEDL